jgi:hypothetical protein
MSIHEFVSSYDYMRDGGCIVVGKRDVNGVLTPTIILSNDTLTESERTTLALRLVKLLNVADHLKSETLLDGSPVALLHGHAANAYYGLTDELKDHTGLLIRMGLDNNATPGDIYAKVKNLLDLNAGSSSREQNFTAFCNNLHRLTGGFTGADHQWDAVLLDKLLNHTRDKLGAPCQAIIDIAESYELPCDTWEKALEGLDAMIDELRGENSNLRIGISELGAALDVPPCQDPEPGSSPELVQLSDVQHLVMGLQHAAENTRKREASILAAGSASNSVIDQIDNITADQRMSPTVKLAAIRALVVAHTREQADGDFNE